MFQPAESLEGNFLAAYIAGAARDTAAAATFYREALKEDPRNPGKMVKGVKAGTGVQFSSADRVAFPKLSPTFESTVPGKEQGELRFDYLSELRSFLQWRVGNAVLLGEANVSGVVLDQ